MAGRRLATARGAAGGLAGARSMAGRSLATARGAAGGLAGARSTAGRSLGGAGGASRGGRGAAPGMAGRGRLRLTGSPTAFSPAGRALRAALLALVAFFGPGAIRRLGMEGGGRGDHQGGDGQGDAAG